MKTAERAQDGRGAGYGAQATGAATRGLVGPHRPRLWPTGWRSTGRTPAAILHGASCVSGLPIGGRACHGKRSFPMCHPRWGPPNFGRLRWTDADRPWRAPSIPPNRPVFRALFCKQTVRDMAFSPKCVAGPGARGRGPAWDLTGQVGTGRRRQAEAMPGCTGCFYVSIPAASGALVANEGTLRCPPTRAQVLEGGVNPRHRRLRRRRPGRPGCAAFCAGLVPRNSLSDTLIEGYQLCFASRFWLPNF